MGSHHSLVDAVSQKCLRQCGMAQEKGQSRGVDVCATAALARSPQSSAAIQGGWERPCQII